MQYKDGVRRFRFSVGWEFVLKRKLKQNGTLYLNCWKTGKVLFSTGCVSTCVETKAFLFPCFAFRHNSQTSKLITKQSIKINSTNQIFPVSFFVMTRSNKSTGTK